MGRYNFHLEIRFADSVRWIARIKLQNAATPPAAVCDYLIRSEASTYRFLEKTTVPVPKVHEVVSDSANSVHVPYILMDMVPGQPINNCVDATPEQLRKVMAQLASVYCELDRHSFDKIGSLDGLENDHLGPVANQLVATLSIPRAGGSAPY
jgi:Phosphotransferase enzyme family